MALKKLNRDTETATQEAAGATTEAQAPEATRQDTTQSVEAGATGQEAAVAAEAQAPAEAAAHADAAAKVAATTAIAAASSTSVAVADAAAKAKQFQREVQDMKGASDFTYGNFRVFKGNNGEISESGGDEDSLGRWAQVRLLSWDDHYEISPGEQGASTKDFVAYSKGGEVIDSVIGEELKQWVGKPVREYLEYLKNEEEFANAKTRRFIDTACALLGTDSGDGPIGEVIQVTLSESSIPAFSRYQEELKNKARCVAMGLPGFKLPEDPFTFFFIREVTSKGDNRWTKLRISASLPAKL